MIERGSGTRRRMEWDMGEEKGKKQEAGKEWGKKEEVVGWRDERWVR